MNIVNKKAYHEFLIIREFVAGIQLVGSEVKSISNGDANLRDSYAFIFNNEVYIKDLYIAKYKQANQANHIEKRDRKLLLTKKEIRTLLKEVKTTGVTIIPLEIFPLNGKFKVKIALAKGKKLWDKKFSIRENDLKREARLENIAYK